MKLRANDTMHVSSARAENLRKGDEFEVSDGEAKQLIERGLATKVAEAPKNKMNAAPKNKAVAKGGSRKRGA